MHDIWRLKHFLAIAEAGSFHAAARQLNISQPALTKSIRQLEESFGTELFLRLPRGVRLTESGEQLRLRAREIEAAWTAATVEIGAQAAGVGGHLRIGGGPVYCATYLPGVLADLRRQFPNLRISVMTGVGSELLPALKVGDIRAYAGGIPDTSTELGSQFVTERLYDQANALFASADHPLFAQGRTPTPEETLSYPWLCLFSGDQANLRIDRYFRSRGLPAPIVALESHSIQIALKMVASHRFIACMPVPLISAASAMALREVELPEFRWSIPTGITYHRSSATFGPMIAIMRALRRMTAG
jgi:DNA-binding transcriptional LysR family regulator